jgi:hypothetical protein
LKKTRKEKRAKKKEKKRNGEQPSKANAPAVSLLPELTGIIDCL